MLTTVKKQDILKSPCQTLTCPVNTVGVMGAGLARQFKEQLPFVHQEYRKLHLDGRLDVYKLHTVPLTPISDDLCLLFPTKHHFRDPSQLRWIDHNLEVLSSAWEALGIETLAIPPIGCGLGGLDFKTEVFPLLRRYFADHPLAVTIYLP